MSSKPMPWRRRRLPLPILVILIAVFTIIGLLMVDLGSIDPPSKLPIKNRSLEILSKEDISANMTMNKPEEANGGEKCATVEERGASRVRELPPEQFCNHGFVIGKASEAGLGNEPYKILTAAALSVMLNRSLKIGQTRGRYPFGDYISYSDYHGVEEKACGFH